MSLQVPIQSEWQPKKALRDWVSRRCPGLLRTYYALRTSILNRTLSAERTFERIHQENLWGDLESVSGTGSTIRSAEIVCRELAPLLNRFGVRILLDAPCGDFNWMRHVNLGDIRYLGVDIVGTVIDGNRKNFLTHGRQFLRLDIAKDTLPKADAILCRDCFIHLSYAHIFHAISNFKKTGAKYLLATQCPGVRENADIVTGSFRPLNLTLEPFHFPSPIEAIYEDGRRPHESRRLLALWNLQDLPVG